MQSKYFLANKMCFIAVFSSCGHKIFINVCQKLQANKIIWRRHHCSFLPICFLFRQIERRFHSLECVSDKMERTFHRLEWKFHRNKMIPPASCQLRQAVTEKRKLSLSFPHVTHTETAQTAYRCPPRPCQQHTLAKELFRERT